MVISANRKICKQIQTHFTQSSGRTISSVNIAALPKPLSTQTTQGLALAGGIPSINLLTIFTNNICKQYLQKIILSVLGLFAMFQNAGRDWRVRIQSLKPNWCLSPTLWWPLPMLSGTFIGDVLIDHDATHVFLLCCQAFAGAQGACKGRLRMTESKKFWENAQNLQYYESVKWEIGGRQFPFRQIEFLFHSWILAEGRGHNGRG